ncbi:MAG: hypothetical protein IJK49_09355 [Prevotella sp.]|nr:hypothetical protein [Prevotella sp.]
MKKLFYSFFALAMTAMTFTSCEDVPTPYDDPIDPGVPSVAPEVEPEGDGTLENPFNSAAANQAALLLESGTESAEKYYIKGKVVSINTNYDADPTFGNATFYISPDGTSNGQFYVYRALYLGNKKYTADLGEILKEGDDVIVCGTLTNYNGTPETAQSKAFLYSLNGVVVDVPMGKPEGDGTLQSPFNATAANQYTAKLAADAKSDKDIYIKGKVAQIATNNSGVVQNYDTSGFGSATFYISDDGTTDSETFYIYRAYYLGNKQYTSGDVLKVGDDVIICGKVVNYRGNTLETSQNEAYLYSLNGKTDDGSSTPQGEPKGSGTQDDPYNATAANNAAKTLDANGKIENVYVKGIISKINSIDTGEWGNANYYISDDGSVESEQFYIYRGFYIDGQKFTSADQIQVGDEVVVRGDLVNHNGNTPEFTTGSRILVHKKAGEGDEDSKVQKTVDKYILTFTIADTEPSEEVTTVNFSEQGWANAEVVTSLDLSDGTKLTFGLPNDVTGTTPKYYDGSKGIRMYANNVLTINPVKPIAKVVITCDHTTSVNYVGNDTLYGELEGNSLKIVNYNTSTSGGVQFRPQIMEITYAK